MHHNILPKIEVKIVTTQSQLTLKGLLDTSLCSSMQAIAMKEAGPPGGYPVGHSDGASPQH